MILSLRKLRDMVNRSDLNIREREDAITTSARVITALMMYYPSSMFSDDEVQFVENFKKEIGSYRV
jgi:hypothetical protein